MRRFSLFFVIIFSAFTALNASSFTVSWIETPDKQAWRGEKVNGRATISCVSGVHGIRLRPSQLKSAQGCIGSDAVNVYFITDVIGDTFSPGYQQCKHRQPADSTKILVADRLGDERTMTVSPSKGQDVWIEVNVPRDALPGVYSGHVDVLSGLFAIARLNYSIEVVDQTLPEPKDWSFHLNLWQNPYSVARYYGDEIWSKEHFEHLRPEMERLRDAGQKAITTSIIRHPWNSQTEDPYETMIKKTRHTDGSWSYDYTDFDKWVEFMMDLGIDKQIDCFSILPWHMTYEYMDAGSGELKDMTIKAQSEEFRDYWSNLALSLATHLKEKGWFERTMIAMDERQPEDMIAAMSVIRNVVPDFKFSLAGWYSDRLAYDFDYLCISSTQEFPADVREIRREKGMVSTYYVCCAERYPNTFIASDPDEATWLGWYAFAHDFDGFLRWSYNSWTADPIDARFRTWTAGDCYIVYPNCSSVRFEKFVEGVQDYEKARILSEQWRQNGQADKLEAMNRALKLFDIKRLGENGACEALEAAKAAITL